MKTLRLGSRGPDVAELQNALNFLGTNVALTKQKTIHPPLVPDGIFGQKTHVRVVEFQKKNGLSADGIVGPKTLAKFDELVPGGLAASTHLGGGAPGAVGKSGAQGSGGAGKFGGAGPGGSNPFGSPTVKGGGAGGGSGAGKWGTNKPGGQSGGGKSW